MTTAFKGKRLSALIITLYYMSEYTNISVAINIQQRLVTLQQKMVTQQNGKLFKIYTTIQAYLLQLVSNKADT